MTEQWLGHALKKNRIVMPEGRRPGIELPPPPAPEKSRSLEGPRKDLTFEVIATSERSIISQKKDAPPVSVGLWGDYSIVLIEPFNGHPPKKGETIVMDRDAIEQKDFEPIARQSIPVDWSKVQRKFGLGKRGIRNSASNSTDYVQLSLLPEWLQAAYRVATETRYGSSFSWNELAGINAMLTDPAPKFVLTVVPDERYVILFDKKNNAIVYDTQNEQGQRLKPRNWRRYDQMDRLVDEMPQEVVAVIDPLLEARKTKTADIEASITSLNTSFSARVTDNRIELLDAQKQVVFTDNVPGKKHVFTDPRQKHIVFYYSESNPREILKIDTSGDPKTWKAESGALDQSFSKIALSNLSSDPTGNFFCYQDQNAFVVVTRDTLAEIGRVPNVTHASFDATGKIRGFNEKGQFVVLSTNIEDLAHKVEEERITKLLEGVSTADLFEKKKGGGQQGAKRVEQKGFAHLEPVKERYAVAFAEEVGRAQDAEAIDVIRGGLQSLKAQLVGQRLAPDAVRFITDDIEASVAQAEQVVFSKAGNDTLDRVWTSLEGSVSLSVLTDARAELDRLRSQLALFDETTRRKYHEVVEELTELSAELFGREGERIVGEVRAKMKDVETQLEGMNTRQEFEMWHEFTFPQIKASLGALASDCPVEASDAYQAIVAARNGLVALADRFQTKFEQEYARVRELAAERMEATVGNLSQDLHAFIERLREKRFKTRTEAERYLAVSEAKKALEGEIAALATQNPDASKDLERSLKSQIAIALSEIERGALVSVAETGQQMVMFGSTRFPKWEARVKEKGQRSVKIAFIDDPRSHGPGVSADQVLGNVGVIVKTTRGAIETVRPYEREADESSWQYGLHAYRGADVPPSYVSAGDYKDIAKKFRFWNTGTLKRDWETKRKELESLYQERAKIGSRDPVADAAWKDRYRAALKDYGTFCAENHISLFRRIDGIQKNPEIDENGKGFVPEWQNHWVVDPETEKNLESMAQAFRMQLDLREGVLNLKGHAGTGKDVLIKMFCHRTGRPYFSTDCTKWTTEYELSEDVILEAKDGASHTIKVPSAVLSGITTPGAVVYFNEVNGMPEQAQIFLHALWDEKRAMTLKTSSGKVIKADPTVLMASSMNPNYPGTFEPQFATKSRMVQLEIQYPPLHRERRGDDKNPNLPFNPSEALRIAREVDSLADFTFEPNMEHNVFVQVWDAQVNREKNDAPKLTSIQEFDVNTIRALVQFAAKLRENFVATFEKGPASRKALPVEQPLTSRELRRCAYALSHMPDTEKVTADPDATARQLIERFFLSHIDNAEDRGKVKTAMANWRSQNRVAA